MSYRGYNEKLDPSEIQDADLRKGIFRAMAKDFLECNRAKAVTDAPGTLARIMERAYKAGMDVARADATATPTDRLVRRMTLHDLPSLSHSVVSSIRHALFGYDEYVREPEAKHLWAFMTPRDHRFPSTMSRDEWRVVHRRDHPFSNKAFGPLVKAGFYDIKETTGGTLRVALLTEWGFEFLATEQTSLPEDRVDGSSSTFHRYRALLQNAHPGYRQAAEQIFGSKA